VINVSLTFVEALPVGILFTLVAAGVLSRKSGERERRSLRWKEIMCCFA
jgi:hypothetical protein